MSDYHYAAEPVPGEGAAVTRRFGIVGMRNRYSDQPAENAALMCKYGNVVVGS